MPLEDATQLAALKAVAETAFEAGARGCINAVVVTRRLASRSHGSRLTRGRRCSLVELGRNLLMDLEDAGSRTKFLIWDPDSKFTAVFDALLADAGLKVVTTGVQMPRMNSIMERWIQTCRCELLDRTLIWNQGHLLHALGEFETFYNRHRPHRTLGQATPIRPLPEPIDGPAHIRHLEVRRRDRLGGTLHEYRHAA
ncbi:integrase core domain-containing protein [Streptomyces sp. NBC_01594]